MDAQPRHLQPAHADPRGVGRRGREAGRRTDAQVAARRLQSDHAPDLERHDVHAQPRQATRRPASDSRRTRRSRQFNCLRALRWELVASCCPRNDRSPRGASASSLLAACASLAHAAAAAAAGEQHRRAALVSQPTTRLSTDTFPAADRSTFLGGGVLIKCPGRGITLRGDSAEQYPDRDSLIGHVVVRRAALSPHVGFSQLLPIDERIVAVGNVNARLPSGSTLVGPIAEYTARHRRIRPRRADDRATRARRSRIVEKDSAGKPAPPMTVVADTVFMDGDSLIYASGQVVITRPDITRHRRFGVHRSRRRRRCGSCASRSSRARKRGRSR